MTSGRATDQLKGLDPRASRARQFASMLSHLLQDFLSTDNAVRKRVYEHLYETAYTANVSIITIPPEWDKLNELEIQYQMVKNHPVILRGEQLNKDKG